MSGYRFDFIAYRKKRVLQLRDKKQLIMLSIIKHLMNQFITNAVAQYIKLIIFN